MLVGRWSEGEPSLPVGLNWTKSGFKYLGVFSRELNVHPNGNLYLIKTSYKVHFLIINNLLAYSLWHRLACVDPPTHLMPNFWGNLQWVPQSVSTQSVSGRWARTCSFARQNSCFSCAVCAPSSHRTGGLKLTICGLCHFTDCSTLLRSAVTTLGDLLKLSGPDLGQNVIAANHLIHLCSSPTA